MINLSGVELDNNMENILQKGLNFAVALGRIPHEDIICAIDNTNKGMPDNTI